MRKILLVTVVLAAMVGSVTPVQAKAITKRSLWFLAPVPMGPRALGVIDTCSDTASELNGVTFQDKVVRAPRRADLLVVKISPTADWDLYLCSRGKELNHSAGGLGAAEQVVISVRPGRAYRIRALNWAGEPDVYGSYVFYNT